MRECVQIAEKMLVMSELPESLIQRLLRVDDLTGFDGGSLRSRQVIAMVIESWEREQDGEDGAA